MQKEKKSRNGEQGFVMLPWIFAGSIFILVIAVAISRESKFFDSAARIFSGTVRDSFVSEENLKLIAEIDMKEKTNETAASKKMVSSEKNGAEEITREEGEYKESAPVKNEEKKENTTTTAPIYRDSLKECDFQSAQNPNYNAFLNEIAWMGTAESANDEWIELKPNGSQPVDLAGWQIVTDGGMRIYLAEGVLPGNGFYLLERTDDATLPGVSADKIYTGGLLNTGERLRMFDERCELVDEIDAHSGWPDGENDSKKTLERNVYDPGWHTSASSGGTPKAKNSSPVIGQASAPPPAPPPENIPPATPPQESPQESSPGPTSTPASQTVSTVVPIVTEIMAGVDGNASYEFIEIYNPGDTPIDLTGWSIKKRSSTGSESPLLVASRLGGKSVPPHRYFLAANEGGYTGTVAADVSWATSNTLAYTSNAIVLYDASGMKVAEVAWAEIAKGESYERESFTSETFRAQPAPSPKNSQGE